MDVSLRHWPIFATGLLLGAAGTMSLGLHRPTQAELAAASLAPVSSPGIAGAAAPAALAAVTPAPDPAQLAEERMLAAAEAFRAQEALAAAEAPYAVAIVAPPKPRIRRVVKEAPAEAAIAAATASADSSEPAPVRPATSVMGAAPEPVQAARGSAHSRDVGESGSFD